MSWTAIILTSSVLLGGAMTYGAARRRRSRHVPMGGEWVVAARVGRLAEPPETRPARLRRWWQVRAVRGYVHGHWQRCLPVTSVVLERRHPQRSAVRVNHDYEVDLFSRPRPFWQLRLQMQLTVVALSAIVAAVWSGRERSTVTTPPHDVYAPGGPAGVGIAPQWLMNSLSTPSPHPFRTNTVSAHTNTSGTNYPHSNLPPVPAGHTNAIPVHTNTFTAHSNLVTHTNAITAHTNTDTRPIGGPF